MRTINEIINVYLTGGALSLSEEETLSVVRYVLFLEKTVGVVAKGDVSIVAAAINIVQGRIK